MFNNKKNCTHSKKQQLDMLYFNLNTYREQKCGK